MGSWGDFFLLSFKLLSVRVVRVAKPMIRLVQATGGAMRAPRFASLSHALWTHYINQ